MTQSLGELEEQLKRQIRFLKKSCSAFDAGEEEEAVRIAVTLRILLHDSKQSKSLLGLLGKLAVPFVDSSTPVIEGSLIPFDGLTFISVGAPGPRYVALLDEALTGRQTPFDEWWSASIFLDALGERISRRKLVTTMANQDGGAHVDSALDETYGRLSRANSMGLLKQGQDGAPEPMGNPTWAAIRQVAHEVLKTIEPKFDARPAVVEAVVGRMAITSEPPPHIAKIHYQGPGGTPTPDQMECPCGSGSPYKGCHNRIGLSNPPIV